MADFGPQIFHALAHLADADAAPGAQRPKNGPYFKTQTDLKVCGFNKTELDINGDVINVVERVETLKNAIFKTLMMRVRNTLYEHHKDTGEKLGECDVSLTLHVSSEFLHGIDKSLPGMDGGENNIVSMEIDNILPDSSSSINLAKDMQGVCANNQQRIRDAFAEDEVFGLLPDFTQT